MGALTHNLRAIRSHVNPTRPAGGPAGTRGARRKILAVIKSNAYGHGIVPVARALSKARADWFGVTCSAEGAELRESGIREPVLILTGFWAGGGKADSRQPPDAGDHERRSAAAPGKGGRAGQRKPRKRPFDFHLKIDTGMNRLGDSAVGTSGVCARAGRLPARAPVGHIYSYCIFGSIYYRTNNRTGKNI